MNVVEVFVCHELLVKVAVAIFFPTELEKYNYKSTDLMSGLRNQHTISEY